MSLIWSSLAKRGANGLRIGLEEHIIQAHMLSVWHSVLDNVNNKIREDLGCYHCKINLTKYFIFHMIPANFDFFFVCSIGWALSCAAANLACFFFLNSTHPSLFGLMNMSGAKYFTQSFTFWICLKLPWIIINSISMSIFLDCFFITWC